VAKLTSTGKLKWAAGGAVGAVAVPIGPPPPPPGMIAVVRAAPPPPGMIAVVRAETECPVCEQRWVLPLRHLIEALPSAVFLCLGCDSRWKVSVFEFPDELVDASAPWR
jgi:hypothetical protein